MVSTAEVLEAIKGIDLPKSKSEIIKYAQSRNASKAVMDILNKMPDQKFRSAADIVHAVGEIE
ncbi:MAG TPA: DUF2795 domain-containing protein [Deltaproteobacteria bacterium]|jgi:hypothetical protein|nr:DUF2795 domain-containing protein [Deltaproteobacteria bacterium]